MPVRKIVALLPLILVVLLAFPRPGDAYIDPGSGGLLLQALIGGFIAVYVALKVRFGSWLRRFARRSPDRTTNEATEKQG
jgi:hypothetical protein